MGKYKMFGSDAPVASIDSWSIHL